MRALILLTALALAAPAHAELYRSVVVTDGDTIIVPAAGMATGWRVRAVGYDTPELHGSCDLERQKAQQAKQRVIELAKGGLDVTSGLKVDLHGRFLATLRLPDGRDLGAVLVSEGLARAYDGKGARQPWCPGATVPAPG
jgi:endonuclease YncB( thermonuclease family)